MKMTFFTVFVTLLMLTLMNTMAFEDHAVSEETIAHLQFGSHPGPDPQALIDRNHRILEASEGNNHYRVAKLLNQSVGVSYYSIEYNGPIGDTFYPNSGFSNNPIVKNLILKIEYHAPSQFRIKLTDADKNRWEVPDAYPFPHFQGENAPTSEANAVFQVEVQDEPFAFWVTRIATKEVIFDIRSFALAYSDLLIDLTSTIPTENLFGLGERSSRFKMGPSGTYTIWARDKPEVIDMGVSGGHVYGHHPVYLMKEKSGNWHVMLFRSSNAMDVTMNQGQNVRFRVAGGIIDLAFFLGGQTPESAIEQYHDYVGHWTLQPFWAMGNHQSRWGYQNLQALKDIVNKFREIGAPIDVIWSDLDYMINKEDFTIDAGKFPYGQFNDWLREGKIHWVPIIDAGVSRRYTNEKGYAEGIRRDIFIKNNAGQPMLGTVWPGECHYADWFHPDAEKYWMDMLDIVHEKVQFSGIWLDMNEPTNFANGEVNKEWEMSKYDKLPYTPGQQMLKTMTISMDAKHHGDVDEFNVHDLFGTLESKATYMYLKTKTPLPFILTRSSAFGAGQFAAHWTGDNGASWEFMKYATTGVFQFGIFGMPFTGADICGFMRSTTPELCARWYQIGALYPFTRNHNHLEARDQEPWAFRDDRIQETAVKAIKLRYMLLKWFYAQFVEKKGKGLVYKPVFFEFPNEEGLFDMKHDYTDEQVMLGSSLMAVPVYKPSREKYDAYFPAAKWFNFFTGELVHDGTSSSKTMEIDAPLGAYIPLYIRGGSVVHIQDVNGVQWTQDLDNRYELVVAFNQTMDANNEVMYQASGIIMALKSFKDEDVQSKCVDNDCIVDIVVTAVTTKSKALKIKYDFTPRNGNANLDEIKINSIKMYGLPISQEHREVIGFYKMNGARREQPRIAQMEHDAKKGLIFAEVELPINRQITLEIVTDSA